MPMEMPKTHYRFFALCVLLSVAVHAVAMMQHQSITTVPSVAAAPQQIALNFLTVETPPPPAPVVMPKKKVKKVAQPKRVQVKHVSRETTPAPVQLTRAHYASREASAVASIAAPMPAPQPVMQQPSVNTAVMEQDYKNTLRSKIQRHKYYPNALQRRRITGSAVLEFTVSTNGAVVQKRIVKSSGHQQLDRAVLTMLKRAQPLPKPPAEMHGSTRIRIPVDFTI